MVGGVGRAELPKSRITLRWSFAEQQRDSHEMNESEETELLQLAAEMQKILAHAIDSMGGKVSEGLFEHFTFYTAAQINSAVAGYVTLKRAGLSKAAYLLVRPALEAMFRLLAARRRPELVCRIAAAEKSEELKMLRDNRRPETAKARTAIEQQWQDFEQLYRAKYAGLPFDSDPISLYDLAVAAGMEEVYNVQYRLYCKFTHAALRAATGGFDHVAQRSLPMMAVIAATAIETLGQLGADISGYPPLQRKLKDLDR